MTDIFVYRVTCYYGTNFSGIAETYESNSEEMTRCYVWEKANQGFYIAVDGPDGIERYTPEEIQSLYYEGEFDFAL